MLGRWLGVSHMVVSALCYWIITEKGKVLSRTTVQHLAAEEPRDHDVQERIYGYHGSLKHTLGSKDFGTSLDGYNPFINDYEEGIAKGEPNKEGYQGPPYSPDIDKTMDNSNQEREAKYYEQYIGAEVVLRVWKNDKLMGRVRKRVRYDKTRIGKVITIPCMTSIYMMLNILMELQSNWRLI